MKVSNLPPFPCVMGIINVTPDSFYAASRVQEEDALRERVRQILDEGGTMIDVGACSTRPGAAEVSADEELARLRWAMPIVRQGADQWVACHTATDDSDGGRTASPVLLSVDTYRAEVAEVCITQLGADVINDVTGGVRDPRMLEVVAHTHAYYIMMHWIDSTDQLSEEDRMPDAGSVLQQGSPIVERVIAFFKHQIEALKAISTEPEGCICRLILDPGFGFGKTLEQNYELMRSLGRLRKAFPDLPLLVGVSRKSMIHRLLRIAPEEALNGTTVLNTYALMQGASILRVHDVKEAVEAVKICGNLA